MHSTFKIDNNVLGFSNSFDDWTGIFSGSDVNLYPLFNSSSCQTVMTCNQVEDNGSGIYFRGKYTQGCKFQNNTMAASNLGLVLDNAILGTQGSDVWNSANQWPAGGYSSPQLKTYTKNSTDPAQSILWVNNSADELPGASFNGNDFSGSFPYSTSLNSIKTVNLAGNNAICNIAAAKLANPSQLNDTLNTESVSVLEDYLNDTVSYSAFAEQEIFEAKLLTYRLLLSNPSLKDTSSVLQSFFEKTQNETIGKLIDIETAVSEKDFNSAASLSNSFSTSNPAEENYKLLYSLLSKIRSKQFNSSDSLSLIDLAKQCPLSGGSAVSKARILYNNRFDEVVHFTESCSEETVKYKTTGISNSVEARKISVYPNPANRNVIIAIKGGLLQESVTVQITEITGKIVHETSTNNTGIIPIELNLTSGLYFIKVKFEDGSTNVEKLILRN